jgi:tetraacyldisaccharide 4'-kinase
MRAPDFWQGQNFGSRVVAAALSPLGFFYGASVAWKAKHATPYRARAKVVCVGNLTVGGTGKTPVAIAIAEMLAKKGKEVFFLSRGYGGIYKHAVRVTADMTAKDVGDEPLLLAQAGSTIVAANRAEGAKLADADGADVIIMDDGHQNFSLVKDLSILVIDGASGFGNGRVVPAGPLREPVQQGISRADAAIIMGEEEASLPDLGIPTLHARLENPVIPELKGARVLAFAGIGRPEKFFRALPSLGVPVVETAPFADHHFYSQADIARLRRAADKAGARLVTTEKDYVRLPPADRTGIIAIPVRAHVSDPSALQRLLDRL